MPRVKTNNKKGQTKVAAASSADAKVLKNENEEVAEELKIDSNSLANGSANGEEIKVTKRSSGRVKHVVAEVEEQAPPGKKPAAKARGKKKLAENEVKENGADLPQVNQVEDEVIVEVLEIITKPKGRGGKKTESKTKKKDIQDQVEQTPLPVENVKEVAETTDAKAPEKKAKATSGKKKKQEVSNEKNEEIEDIEEKPVVDEIPEEKVTKKSSKASKKVKENLEETPQVEPAKKRGKSSQKEKQTEDVKVEDIEEIAEVELPVPAKKPAKRGRAAAKTAITQEEDKISNADTEEVLPKKRSRKAPSVEKDVVPEKSKKGRGKKPDKVVDQLEAVMPLKGKEEIATNGQDKMEKIEEIEEPQSGSNKKAANKTESAAVEPATKARGGRKRAAPSANKKTKTAVDDDMDDGEDNGMEDEADGSKPSKTKKKTTDSAPVNATDTKYNKADFELTPLPDGQTADLPRFNLKISSWNVAGLRSWVKKEGLKFLEYEQPDIFCMQETKCTNDQLPEEVQRIPGYHPYWLCMPGGYAGVAIYSKIMPINVEYGIGNKQFDDCGRIITAEYEKFFLINVYVPNSGRKLVNLEARMQWEKLFVEFVQNLDARKPVIICGDMNVSHQEQDLANPKTNTRNAGFTKEERDKMSELLALGYVDTFRHLYPNRKGAYTYWTYMANARSRNVGWRLDYFIASERFINRIVDNCIRSQCLGSDHCPITLFLKL